LACCSIIGFSDTAKNSNTSSSSGGGGGGASSGASKIISVSSIVTSSNNSSSSASTGIEGLDGGGGLLICSVGGISITSICISGLSGNCVIDSNYLNEKNINIRIINEANNDVSNTFL
jgi:hypothetical protein